ncbi:MAG: DUF456 domain-containing protein [Alistipes sp.]|nr:DUF456 domain-containing protein [Alistipes sp.]
MTTLLIILSVTFGFLGLLGAIVPVIPGTILSYAGLVCIYFTDSSTVTNTQLIIWGMLSFVVIFMDYVLPGYFSKMFGGSKKGIIGANVGTIIGIFFGPAGIIAGPFLGAFIGELINDGDSLAKALKVGFGSTLSFIAGTGAKLIVGGFILYYILSDTIALVGSAL